MTSTASRSLLITTALFLGLHLVAPHVVTPVLWGVDMLVHYPPWAHILFAGLGLLLVVPPSRVSLTRIASGIIDAAASKPRLSACLLVVTFAFCFLQFKTATHLLGDGYYHIRQLAATSLTTIPRTDRAPLVFWIVKLLNHAGDSLWHSPETTYRLLSWSSGIAYLVILLISAGKLFDNRSGRAAWFGIMLTAGYMQLFFGYVETYPVVFPLCLLYLMLGAQCADGKASLIGPAILIPILMGAHLSMVTLVPSFVLLCWIRLQSGTSVREALAGSAIRKAAIILLLVVAALVAYRLRHHVLPIISNPEGRFAFAILSLEHTVELLNQYLLVAPAAILLLPLLATRSSLASGRLGFAFAAGLFPVLATVVANPSIGAFRDWDAFAFAALPISFWSTLVLVQGERSRVLNIAVPACAAALLHTALFIGINADTARGEDRFKRNLTGAPLTVAARGYGWEIYGSYLRDVDRVQDAIAALEEGTRVNPKHRRLWANAGFLQIRSGENQRALTSLQKAVQLDPGFFDAWLYLGIAAHRLEKWPAALSALNKAVEIQRESPEAHFRLAELHHDSQKLRQAVQSYEQALKLKPDMVEARVNMAGALVRLGLDDEAAHHLEVSLRVQTTAASLQMLGDIHARAGRHEQAAFNLTLAIQAGAETAPAYGNLANSLFHLGQYALAVRYYEKAVSRRPEMVGAYYGLAASSIQLGRLSQARAYAAQFARLSPDDPRLTSLMQRLRTEQD